MKWYMLNFENKFIEYEKGEWARRRDVTALLKKLNDTTKLLCPYCGSDDVFGNVNSRKGLTFCNKCEGDWEI